MRWLITGVCGFIGRNLVAYLQKHHPQDQIRGLDNLSASRREDLAQISEIREDSPFLAEADAPYVRLIVGDITDAATVRRAMEDVDVVAHLAADSGVLPSIEDPLPNFHTNVMGTVQLLEGARLTNPEMHFIFASTSAALGEQEPPIHEQKVRKPISPYGAGKAAAEAYCQAYAGSYGMKTTCLRFSNVYGPYSNQKTSVVAKFIRKAFEGEQVTIYGSGEQTRDFIFVEDLVAAVVASATHDVAGEIFQIATHQETSINSFFAMLKEVLRAQAGIELACVHGAPNPGEIMRNFSDITKAKTMLEWTPVVGLQEGLVRTIQWFVQQQKG